MNHAHGPATRRMTGLAALTLASALALVPLVAAPAAANIPSVVSGYGVGVYFEYDYTSGRAPVVAYPYVVRTANGERATAYCVQWPIGTDRNVEYDEGAWDGVAGLRNVHWILQNGSPSLTSAELAAAVTAATGHVFTDVVDDFVTHGVTQMAIWHFTDGLDFDKVHALREQVGNGGSGDLLNHDDVRAIFDYLTDPAYNEGLDQPAVSLALDAGSAAWSGDLYGPIVVDSSATVVNVSTTTPDVTITDASGAAVTSAVDGQPLFVRADPATPGAADLLAEAPDALFATGQLLVAPGFQTLALGEEHRDVATYALDLQWDAAPPPEPPTLSLPPDSIPPTGAEQPLVPGAIAVVLTMLGGGAIAWSMRRRAAA